MADFSGQRKTFKSSCQEFFSIGTSFIRIILTVVFAFTVCCVLLIVVCLLPDERIDDNITVSADKMEAEGNYPRWLPDSIYYQLDNWTESSLLNMIYTGDNKKPLQAAFAQKEYSLKNQYIPGVGSLTAAVHDSDNKDGIYILRSTYWLGIRSIIIPLLMVMDYYTIRLCLLVFSFLILLICTLRLSQKTDWATGGYFCASFIVLNWFAAAAQCGNGGPCLWICCIAVLYILNCKKELDICCLFVLIGAATCYLDWFSCPLITFGYPAVVIILLEKKRNKMGSSVHYLNLVFRSGLGWCIGYGGLLAGRVLITTAVAGEGAWNNFTDRVKIDIAGNGSNTVSGFIDKCKVIISGIHGIFPLQIMSVRLAAVMVMICLLIIMILTICYRRKFSHMVGAFLISLAPFTWFAVFNSFCQIHYWFAYRVFSLTVFIWLVMITEILKYQYVRFRKICAKIIFCAGKGFVRS